MSEPTTSPPTLRPLVRRLRRLRVRLAAQRGLRAFAWTAPAAITLAAALVLADRLIFLDWPALAPGDGAWFVDLGLWRLLGAAASVALLTAAAGAALLLPSRHAAAQAADRALALRERLSTALALDEPQRAAPFGAAVARDALAHLDRLTPTAIAPWRAPRALWALVPAAALLAAAWTMTPRDLLDRRAARDRARAAEAAVAAALRPVFQESADAVETLLSDPESSAALADALREWRDAEAALDAPGNDAATAQARLRALEGDLRARADALRPALDALGARVRLGDLARFHDLAAALRTGALDQLDDALAQGLETLLEDLAAADPEARRALAAQAAADLRALLEALADQPELAALARTLERLAQALEALASGDGASAADLEALRRALAASRTDLAELARWARDLAALEALADACEWGQFRLSEQEADAACTGADCPGDHAGLCRGRSAAAARLRALAARLGQGAPSLTGGGGLPGAGRRDSSPTEGETTAAPERAPTPWSGDRLVAALGVRGMPEESLERLSAAHPLRQAVQEQLARLNDERIPPDYREHVRRYHERTED